MSPTSMGQQTTVQEPISTLSFRPSLGPSLPSTSFKIILPLSVFECYKNVKLPIISLQSSHNIFVWLIICTHTSYVTNNVLYTFIGGGLEPAVSTGSHLKNGSQWTEV